MHRFFLAIVLIGCGGKTDDAAPSDAAPDSPPDAVALPDARMDDVGDSSITMDVAIPDVAPPPMGCDVVDKTNPPIGCSPAASGAATCSNTSKVATCPMGNACMATATPAGSTLDHRVGRLRFFAPDALLSLTPIAIDPNVNSRCFASGTEELSLLMRVDRDKKTLTIGGAHPSAGGVFSFAKESIDLTDGCPGAPPASASVAPVTTSFSAAPLALDATLPSLVVPIFDSGGFALPLKDVRIRVPSFGDGGRCVGSWDAKYWCDGDSLGWTTGGSLVGHITVEDADRAVVKSAGCQTLCAILVNDATKVDFTTKRCKRGADGKLPEYGDSCVGGAGCKNAFLVSVAFASYQTTITP